MTKPMLLAEFGRLPPAMVAMAGDGLSAAIDSVAVAAPPTHQFLRYHWYAAALAAYGGQVRTILVEADREPQIALPMIAVGPRWAGLAAVPGAYWPFRSFPARADADPGAFALLLSALAREVNALRLGPVYDDDPSAMALLAAARAQGWAVLDRFIADSYVLDMAAEAAQGWPRNSTLRKNRLHEKHLGDHGTLDWRFLDGAALRAGGFESLAAIEEKSWVAGRTDGHDAKFTAAGHGAFWRRLPDDPVIGAMMHAALLTVDGAPAAFSFDMNAGSLKYAIATSYDPAFAKHSPGKLLHYRNLVEAMACGITKVDWGAGDSGYKKVIGATTGPAIRDWLLVRPGLPAMLGRMLQGSWARSGHRPLPSSD
jgi:CelD/BcsL family acetyltransferase involved in cellulose biosynthesis